MESIESFISPEFLAVVPVLYFVGMWLKRRKKFRDENIPITLGILGVGLSVLHTFGTMPIQSPTEIASALFTAFTQGILCAGASVYTHQIFKQGRSAAQKPPAPPDPPSDPTEKQ